MTGVEVGGPQTTIPKPMILPRPRHNDGRYKPDDLLQSAPCRCSLCSSPSSSIPSAAIITQQFAPSLSFEFTLPPYDIVFVFSLRHRPSHFRPPLSFKYSASHVHFGVDHREIHRSRPAAVRSTLVSTIMERYIYTDTSFPPPALHSTLWVVS